MGNYDRDNLTDICAEYSGGDYYVEEAIPGNKLFNARQSFPIPAEERVIAFVDATVFGSGKNGLAICASGVYWHNDWTTDTERNFLDWMEFAEVHIRRAGVHDIELGVGNVFNMSGSSFRKDVLVSLLKEIQDEIIEILEEEDSYDEYEEEEYEDDEAGDCGAGCRLDDDDGDNGFEWRIAIDGQQYGPYDLALIKSMVQALQFAPDSAYVWKPGMSDWVPFLRHPETAALVVPAAPAITVTPTPPSSNRGASISADSIDELLEDGNVTEPIDVNNATWERLIDLPSVGAADAKRIVEARQENGGFRSAEEVGALLGMKPHQVERLRRRAVFGGLASTATPSRASSSVIPSTASRTGFSTSPAAETRQGSLTTSSTASPSSASPSASAPSSAPSAASRRIIDF
ncbi:helix-hairpin-helix domain-containing protein [Cohnella herbarum]|uniref:DUF4339 domain-containing protein n=1 Tax=Cohnella herbarum TaxID=2728023 RepID=A0A7Z2VNP2_9BACL|nr:helix-hairpin-helix domain-containing protein [Cohnella herbarum]QJD86424.1 DUF4339 domain-containing protein [Cohnella herbarum]